MPWYHMQFDRAWVRCPNTKCRYETTFVAAKSKRKCPKCGINSMGLIGMTIRKITKEAK